MLIPQSPQPLLPALRAGTPKELPCHTHAERRALGGRVLATVGAVDAVPLHQLIRRGVCPEVVGGLHLRVLQRAGPHCAEKSPTRTHQGCPRARGHLSELQSPGSPHSREFSGAGQPWQGADDPLPDGPRTLQPRTAAQTPASALLRAHQYY